MSMVVEILNHLATENEDFLNSSFYTESCMFENHDKIFFRNAEAYLLWIQTIYGDKWTEHIGGLAYGEDEGKMTIHVTDEDGNIIAR